MPLLYSRADPSGKVIFIILRASLLECKDNKNLIMCLKIETGYATALTHTIHEIYNLESRIVMIVVISDVATPWRSPTTTNI